MPWKTVQLPNGMSQPVYEGGGEGAQSPLETLSKTLSLVDLVNRVQQAPIESATKQAELKLKEAEVGQIPIKQLQARTDLIAKQNAELRAQSEFQTKKLEAIPSIFTKSFDLGTAYLKQNFPGAEAVKKDDGEIAILMPTPNGIPQVFELNTRRVTDPEKLLDKETGWRETWEKGDAKEYATIFSARTNIQKLADRGLGTDDVALLYNFIKVLDPNSVVKEGEIQLSREASPLTQQYANLYKKAFTEQAPILPEATRKNIVATATTVFQTARDAAINKGKNLARVAKSSYLRPENVVSPVGDLTLKDFLAVEAPLSDAPPPIVPAGPMPSYNTPSQQRPPQAQEAGIAPTSKAEAPRANFQGAMQNWLNTISGGKRGKP